MGWLLRVVLLAVLHMAPLGAEISFPRPGDALQGTVLILGTSETSGFVASDLEFAYSGDNSGTWFLIRHSDTAVYSGLLAEWDTSLIVDGDYILRLRITTEEGIVQEAFVTGLRVRNTLPIESATPPAVSVGTEIGIPATPTAALMVPTGVETLANRAAMTSGEVYSRLVLGMMIGLGLVLVPLVFKGLWKNR